MNQNKKCTECKCLKVLSDFPYRNKSLGKRRNKCKECGNKKARERYNSNIEECRNKKQIYRDKNRNQIRSASREYIKNNKDHISEINKKYRENNKEKISEMNKTWRENNKERVKIYQKRYNEDNKDYISERSKKYRENNKKYFQNYRKEYYKLNKEKINKQKRNWEINKLNSDPSYRYSHSLNSELRALLKSVGSKSKTRIHNVLGISSKGFKGYIESLFVDGMDWDKYSDIHIDHRYPKSLYKKVLNPKTQVNIIKMLNHYTNLQPLWSKHNLSKSSSTTYILPECYNNRNIKEFKYKSVIERLCGLEPGLLL